MNGTPPRKDHRRIETLAGFYGLHLMQQGLAPDEAARKVIERYPAMRGKLDAIAHRRPYAKGATEETNA